MDWDANLRAADGVEINRVADGYIVYYPERDRVHYLNHTAVLLLEFCNGQTAARELPALLQTAYGLSDAPTEEVAQCLGKLLEEGLVPLIFERSVHLLVCDFHITCDCEELVGWLDRLCQRAEQHYPASEHHRFEIHRADGGYRIVEDGRDEGWEPRPGAAGYVLFQRMHRTALAALGEFAKIHAGYASWNDRRFLVVGAAQSGKTTLMTRLLYEGFTVYGDELVLLRDGQALAYPRRFGVRPPTLALVPQLSSIAAAAGSARIFAVDPVVLGFPWRITPGPVAAVFIVEPNHGGESAVTSCPQHLMAQRIMTQSWAPSGGVRAWIAEVCAILTTADCHVLRLGDLATAVAALKATVGRQHDGC